MVTDEEFNDLKARVKIIEEVLSSGQIENISKKQSIREFLLSKNPKTDANKILVIAYYLEKQEEMAVFNVKDLMDCFRNAKEKLPTNMNARINDNIKYGYIMPSKDKKDNNNAWTLTNTGERFVENGFKKD